MIKVVKISSKEEFSMKIYDIFKFRKSFEFYPIFPNSFLMKFYNIFFIF